MRICIAGAGAVGSVIAGYLLDGGKHDVSVLARGETLHAIRASGLRVESRGRTLASRPSASDNAKDLGQQDVVIVAVKGYGVPELAHSLAPLLASGTLVVTAQNGIPWWYFHCVGGPEDGTPFETVDPGGIAWRTLGPERAIGCIVSIPAARTAPGVVHHDGALKLVIGAPKAGTHGEALTRLAGTLNDAGIETTVADDIRLATWSKLQSQVATAPIGVLTGGTNGQIETATGLDGLKGRASAECIAVANAWNVALKPNPNRVSAGNPGHKSSMLQDYEAGRPLELDAIVAAVIELGKRRNVATPTIEALWALAKLRMETRTK